MEYMKLVQLGIFYLIVIGFVAFGAWKGWEYFKNKKARENEEYKEPYTIEKVSSKDKRFLSTDDLKRNFERGF